MLAPMPAAPPAAPEAVRRADALDVLRGLAILLMVLSGIVPFGVLPPWMYHVQVPPPDHVFDAAVRGISWVDLVFPFFLFALGAALPLALGRRRAAGAGAAGLVGGLVWRALGLLFFAVFLQHLRPFTLSGGAAPSAGVWGLALASYACLWLLYTRWPAAWPAALRRGLPVAGLAGAVALLAAVRYPDGSGFQFVQSRYDIILVVLANVLVAGGALYLATRTRPILRWAALAVLAAAVLAGAEPGWVQPVMAAEAAWGLVRAEFLKYLFLVVPGIAAGEGLAAWLAAPPDVAGAGWSRGRVAGVALGAVALVAGMTGALYAREVFAAAAAVALGGAALLAATRAPGTASERLWANLLRQGLFWLALGLVAEPFEGGIRKDHATFSYYFVTAGMAFWLLAAFGALAERLGAPLRLLRANGQNPMLAYVSLQQAVLPVLALTGLDALFVRLMPTPWAGAARGLAYTLLVAGLVAACSRARLFWRT